MQRCSVLIHACLENARNISPNIAEWCWKMLLENRASAWCQVRGRALEGRHMMGGKRGRAANTCTRCPEQGRLQLGACWPRNHPRPVTNVLRDAMDSLWPRRSQH